MAPLQVIDLDRRDIGPGNVFTISFCLIAFLVLSLCAYGFFFLPWLHARRENNQDHDSEIGSQHENTNNIHHRNNLTTMTFPSHPVVLRETKQNTSTELRTYNPRCETPFPSQPQSPQVRSINSPVGKAQQPNASTTRLQNQRDPNTSGQDDAITQKPAMESAFSEVESRRGTGQEQARMIGCEDEHVTGDAKSHHPALPYTITQDSNFQDPFQQTTRLSKTQSAHDSVLSDKHFHPNKLFRDITDLDTNYSRSIAGTRESGFIDRTSSLGPDEVLELDDDSQFETEHGTSSIGDSDFTSVANVSTPSSEADQNEVRTHNPSLAALERLKTYRSLTGAKDPRKLTRMATVTRSKTPVADIRSIFDKMANQEDHKAKVQPHREHHITGTSSMLHSSDFDTTLSTVPTVDFTASSTSLLPTPLKPRTAVLSDITSSQPVQNLIIASDGTVDTYSNLDVPAIDEPYVAKRQTSAVVGGRESGKIPFRYVRRSILSESCDLTTSSRRTMRSNSAFSPSAYRQRLQSRQRSSSLYSRDTRGLSLANMLARVTLKSAIHQHVNTNTSASVTAACDTDQDASQSKSANHRTQARSEIDDWHDNMEAELGFDKSPSPSIQQALSRLGPELRFSRRVSRATNTPSMISSEFNMLEANEFRRSIPHISIKPSADDNRQSKPYHELLQDAISPKKFVRRSTTGSGSASAFAAMSMAPGGVQWL